MSDTEKSAAFYTIQKTAEVIMLAPETTLTKAELIIEKAMGRSVDVMKFYSTQLGFSWKLTGKKFFEACRGAKVVILHDWVQAGGLNQSYQLAEKIAKAVKKFDPKIKIFASTSSGGHYDVSVHKVAGVTKIFSFDDEEIIKALQA